MDTVIQKFYSNGKTSNDGFNSFGAFPSFYSTRGYMKQARTTSAINPLSKATLKPPTPVRQTPLLGTTTKSVSFNPNPEVINPSRGTPFDGTKSVVFNSTSDMLNPPLPNYRGELYQLRQAEIMDAKRNATKVQMMEEKMKNLELKSQRLEVINDFFFDMFENNLIREEMMRQRGENNQKIKEDESNEKIKKPDDEIAEALNGEKDTKNLQFKGGVFDPKEFQAKTLKNASKILKNIKKSVAEYILEEQLKKNEELQSMTEDILDIKNEITSRLNRMQSNQKIQMESLAYILQNSGNPKIEELASRVLDNPYYDYRNTTTSGMYKIKGEPQRSPSQRQSTTNKQKIFDFLTPGRYSTIQEDDKEEENANSSRRGQNSQASRHSAEETPKKSSFVNKRDSSKRNTED